MTDTAARTKALIAELSGKPIEAVTDDAKLIDDLALDSLDVINLEVELGRAFDVDIEPDETDALKTVGDTIALIERKLAS
jgi:acyl carrier protein